MIKEFPNEWTQKEFLRNKIELEKEGVKVLLIDTILNPIAYIDTMTYNPALLKDEPEGSVFVFYCDSGKATMDRLQEYKEKFPKQHCLSLKGGRGYWRKHFQILDENKDKHEEIINEFITCINETHYYEAHEALEKIWFPRRFEDDAEMKLIKGFINAAVSFELIKRGRPESSAKVWETYEKYKVLLGSFESPYNDRYKELSQFLEKKRGELVLNL